MSINKNEPAFPEMICMDKRFYAACAAMQALIPTKSSFDEEYIIAMKAFRYADALLEHEEYLNKQKKLC